MGGIFSQYYKPRLFYSLVLFVLPSESPPLHIPVALVGRHYSRPELLQEMDLVCKLVDCSRNIPREKRVGIYA